MDIDRLLKIKSALLRHPQNFDMGSWFKSGGEDTHWYTPKPESVDDCGTTACIGGWAMVLFNAGRPLPGIPHFETAQQLLGLTYDQAKELFFAFACPADVKAAAQMIDNFIFTDGREAIWEYDVAELMAEYDAKYIEAQYPEELITA